jgi:DNA-binding transcriptional LysR family regulator
MVHLEELASLDFILWLRTGQRAGRMAGLCQSTISRRMGRCLHTFNLSMERRQGEWDVSPSPLLRLERELHQLWRAQGHAPLRLEGCPRTAPLLLQPAPPGWIQGAFDHVGVTRPLTLLRERVIDAWISDALDDLPPAAERSELAVIPLWSSPVTLYGAPDHPLIQERGLTLQDLRCFPCLDLPAQGFPHSRAQLQALGLGALPVQLLRYEPESWEQRSNDRATLMCFTPLNLLTTDALMPLDHGPLFHNRGGLLCHRDLVDHPAIRSLEGMLRLRLAQLAPLVPMLERL